MNLSGAAFFSYGYDEYFVWPDTPIAELDVLVTQVSPEVWKDNWPKFLALYILIKGVVDRGDPAVESVLDYARYTGRRIGAGEIASGYNPGWSSWNMPEIVQHVCDVLDSSEWLGYVPVYGLMALAVYDVLNTLHNDVPSSEVSEHAYALRELFPGFPGINGVGNATSLMLTVDAMYKVIEILMLCAVLVSSHPVDTFSMQDVI